MRRFFIFCSGADHKILEQCPNSERIKYGIVGSTVFLTGFLASLSGGYALYTVFRGGNKAGLWAVFFGLLWGIVIFNLDRFLVSSIRKEGNWKKEFWYALPRFVVAVIISLVIAKPIEVQLFADRIQQQILENKTNKLVEGKAIIDSLNDVGKLESSVNSQQTELKQLETLRSSDPPAENFKRLIAERNEAGNNLARIRTANNPRIGQYNEKINIIKNNQNNYYTDNSDGIPVLRTEHKREIAELARARNSLVVEISDARKKVTTIDDQIAGERAAFKTDITRKIIDKGNYLHITAFAKAKADSAADAQKKISQGITEGSYTNNFITQVEAMGGLTKEPFSTMWWASKLLMLLVITIETTPIVVKLLTKRGPYDYLLEEVEYGYELNKKKVFSTLNDEANNLLKQVQDLNRLKGDVKIKVEKAKLDAELKSNEDLLNEIAKRQAELAKIAIDKWYATERKKLNDDPAYQYAVTKGPAKISLEGKLWKGMDLRGEITYHFKNGKVTDNELIFTQNGNTYTGSWEYTKPGTELKITVLNNTDVFTISALSQTTLTLQSVLSGGTIDLVGKQ